MVEKVSKSLLFKEGTSDILPPEKVGERLIKMHQMSNVAAVENANFPVNFQNIVPGSRRDFIFSYEEKVPVRYVEDPEHPGYAMPVEFITKIRKADIVAFLAVTKEGKTEFRAYQIGRRHE